jgi:hypothetical protein
VQKQPDILVNPDQTLPPLPLIFAYSLDDILHDPEQRLGLAEERGVARIPRLGLEVGAYTLDHRLLDLQWQNLILLAVEICDGVVIVRGIRLRGFMDNGGERCQLRNPAILLYWRQIVVEEMARIRYSAEAVVLIVH